MLSIIVTAGLELLAEVVKQIAAAQSAANEEHASILARVQASRAALAGDKTDAHEAVETALANAQAAIDAARAK